MRHPALLLAALLLALAAFSQKSKGGFARQLALQPLTLKDLGLKSLGAVPSNRKAQKTAADCQSICVLPVKWLDISGKRESDSICSLKWETTNEANNIGYDVERSLGNAEHFEKRGFVPAQQKADPVLHYLFTDANDYSGTSYYRLRQVDADGRFSYSKVVAVKGYNKALALVIYPNPAKSNAQALLHATKGGTTILTLLDISGKTVMQKTVPVQKGDNLFSLDLAMLSRGTYLLRATSLQEPSITAVLVKN